MKTIRIHTKDHQSIKQFETLQWCLKAIARAKIIKHLNYLYIDSDFIVGTDGHRIHIAFNDWDYEPGLYEEILVKPNEIILAKNETRLPEEYPSIWRAIPTQCQNGIPSFYCYLNKKDESRNKSQLAYHVYTHTRLCYNLKYLEDIRMEGKMRFELGEDNLTLIVASEDHDRLGLIMPFRQE
jgi:hypothetical protein